MRSVADVQLNQGHLFVSLRGRGGVSSVTIRFDDDAPLSMRSAGTVEKDLSMVDIEGAEFSRLLGARRLRLQIFTILNTLVNEDLDLTGLPAAYDVICSEACR